MSQIRKALVIACSLAAVSGVAHADDQSVVKRLSTHGKLTSSHAKQLTTKVSERMARAADAPPAMIEPLRAALSQALLGTPMPPDGISAAKVRLKLYAGLNEFALEALFAPHPGAIASCQRDLDLASKECEALIAAAGEVSLAQAKRSGGGPAPAPVAMSAVRGAPSASGRFGAPQQGYGGQPQQGSQGSQGSRFGGAPPHQAQQGSRFGGAAPVAAQQQPVQQQQSRFAGNAPPQQNRFGGPAPVQAAPAAAPAFVAAAPQPQPPPAAQVNPQDAATRKAEYEAKRAEYLARKKQEFDERRARAMGGLPGDAPPDVARPVSSSASAAVPAAETKPAAAAAKPAVAEAPAPKVAAKPSAAKKADIMDEPLAEPETGLDADMKAAVGGKEAAPAPGASKAGLDGDFLDGLLDDPTGGKKKK